MTFDFSPRHKGVLNKSIMTKLPIFTWGPIGLQIEKLVYRWKTVDPIKFQNIVVISIATKFPINIEFQAFIV